LATEASFSYFGRKLGKKDFIGREKV